MVGQLCLSLKQYVSHGMQILRYWTCRQTVPVRLAEHTVLSCGTVDDPLAHCLQPHLLFRRDDALLSCLLFSPDDVYRVEGGYCSHYVAEYKS